MRGITIPGGRLLFIRWLIDVENNKGIRDFSHQLIVPRISLDSSTFCHFKQGYQVNVCVPGFNETENMKTHTEAYIRER